MDVDTDKVDDAVLALLYLGLHETVRTWKTFDWNSMERLHANAVAADSEQLRVPSLASSIRFQVPHRKCLRAFISGYRHFVSGGGSRGGNYVIACFGTMRNRGLTDELDSVTPHIENPTTCDVLLEAFARIVYRLSIPTVHPQSRVAANSNE